MRIECAHTNLVKLEDLKPHPANRNKHSEAQIKVLAKIIAQNGQRSPIVVSNQSGFIAKGNGRYEAIKLLGWESCAVDYQNYKDELEELRDRIADNEIARYSEFDQSNFISDLENSGLQLDELDLEEFGLIDFKIPNIDIDPLLDDENDNGEEDENKQYKIEVKFVNDMDMMDLYDDLISKGYLARIIK